MMSDGFRFTTQEEWNKIMLQEKENRIEELLKKNQKLKIALIDSRAEYLNTLDQNPGCSAWNMDELTPKEQNELRRQACESLEMEEPVLMYQFEEQTKQIEELKAFKLAVLEALMRPRKASIQGAILYVKEDIKYLQDELVKNRKLIKNLEETCVTWYANILSLYRDSYSLFWMSAEKQTRYREEAKEVLEKLEKEWIK